MGKFKKYLNENEEKISEIYSALEELDENELDEFGYLLYSEFFDTDEELEEYAFDVDDIREMVAVLGPELYDDILEFLAVEFEVNTDLATMDSEMQEAVSRRMKVNRMNRKKRKFMSRSKAEMRRSKTKRRQEARKKKAARKRYYKANKTKLTAYNRSRRAALKKGKHITKIRRSA